MRIIAFLMLLLASIVTMQAQDKINIPGFGELPYINKDGSYQVNLEKVGNLNLKGTISPLSLETEVKMEQLKDIKGYKTISKLNLENLKIKVSQGGLFLDAEAKTDGALKTLCEALKITTPRIGISTLISKNAFALSGELDFSKAPIVVDVVPKIGTRMSLVTLELGANVGIEYPGKEASDQEKEIQKTNEKNKEKKKKGPKVEFSPSIYVRTEMTFRPTKADPDLRIITQFDYDLVTQEITGAGSMVDTWSNPFGLSKFLPDNSISMTNTAMEIGWIPGSPSPTNIGFYLEKGKFFDLEFAMGLSVAPADGSVALMATRNKMTMNDFTRILREGFKLKVPDVFPQDMYIENAEVLFAPNGGEVGEFEIEEGFAIKGKAKLLNAMEGELDFKMNGDDGFYLDMKMDANFKEAMMNEIRKVKAIAPIMNKVLSTFEVRKVHLHLEASTDLTFKGKTDCHFVVLGKDVQFDIEGSLDIETIKQKLIEKVIAIAGPEAAAVIEAVEKGVQEASRLAGEAISISSNLVKKYAALAVVKKNHIHHIVPSKSDNHCYHNCVPNRVNDVTKDLLPQSKQTIQAFYDRIISDLVKIEGETYEQTKKMREDEFLQEWNDLNAKINEDWEKMKWDKGYVGFFYTPENATNGGNHYRNLFEGKKNEYLNLKNILYQSMINAPSTGVYYKIKNVWKNTCVNTEKGLAIGSVAPGWHSAMWVLEPFGGTKYVRIKNRWKNTFLHIENGKVECTDIGPGAHSSHWEIIYEGQYARIKNRWKQTYLNIEPGYLQCTNIQPGWASAKWDFLSGEVAILSINYDKSAGCGTFYRNGAEIKKHCGWLKNWHTILRVGCSGPNFDDKVLFYNKSTGTGQIYKVDNAGNMHLLMNHTGWGNNWAKITWEASDACNGVIKFETADGYWEKYTCDDNGNINLHSKKQ